ncbi:MAG: hypothetical protein ACK5JT_23160 [Hyphomicrobiaceae bacterium]
MNYHCDRPPLGARALTSVLGMVLVWIGMMLTCVGPAQAQQPGSSGPPQLRGQLPSPVGKAGEGATGPKSSWGSTTVRTPTAANAAPGGRAAIKLSAQLTQDSEPLDQGIVWRVFRIAAPKPNASVAEISPILLHTLNDPSPTVHLPVGSYAVNAAYGLAHLTRRVNVAGPQSRDLRFILNAGGLRVTCHLLGGEQLSPNNARYTIYDADTDQISGRTLIATDLRPGVIVRLNAGLYHIVSTVGAANAQLSSDVTVEAGKLTDAVLSHNASRVTFKLVNKPGGEAMADTSWAIHTTHGDLVRESQGALPTHILAAGTYIASAKSAGRLYQKQFTVTTGQPLTVEIVAR